MKSKIFIGIIFITSLISNIISKSEDELTLEHLLNWCKKNDIIISPKLKLSFSNGILEAIASDDIRPRTELISIPDKMILTVDKILSLLNSPQLNTQYDNFKKIKIETFKQKDDQLHKEEIFLSYLLYLIKHEEEKYNNTELYKTFKEFFLTVENYVSDSPLLYTNEQKEYLAGTYFGKYSKDIRKHIDEEIKILKNDSFYNKDIDNNDFIQKRLFIFNRAYDTSKKDLGKIILVPIYTLLPFDNVLYNARLDYKYENGAKIISSYSIEEGKSITVFSHTKNNVEKMVFEGRINNRNTNYKEIHLIPAYSSFLYYKYDIDDIKLIDSKDFNFNLFEMDFIKNSMLFYKIHSDVFKIEKVNDLWSCNILEENVKYLKDHNEYIMNKIDELFKGENENKIENIKKALKFEWNNLNKQHEKIVEQCNNEKKINKDEEIINEDL